VKRRKRSCHHHRKAEQDRRVERIKNEASAIKERQMPASCNTMSATAGTGTEKWKKVRLMEKPAENRKQIDVKSDRKK